jgi:hypothetical protein
MTLRSVRGVGKRQGKEDKPMPERRCEYPEYASPTAGMMGQQKTVQTRTKSVSVRSHASQSFRISEDILAERMYEKARKEGRERQRVRQKKK